MRIVLTVEVEVQFTSGKFASRDELTERLVEEIESADPGEVYGDEDGAYEVTEWNVMEVAR